MRIALCISGYFTNKNGDNLLESNYIYDNIINNIKKNYSNSLDIFIHSFDKKSEKNINTKYPNTVKTIVQDQINFIENLSIENKEYYNLLLKANYKKGTSYDLQGTLSMIYSRCESIKLAINHSIDNNFKYDVIIRVRFDIGIRLKCPHGGFKPDNFIFNPNKNEYNYKYFYSSYWNQLNLGYVDHWEFSNSENMQLLSEMFEIVTKKMFICNSNYLNILQNNWPGSNSNNIFSNEMLNRNKNNNIQNMKINIKDSSNNHIIQKFIMIECDLYNKSRFIDFTKDNNGKLYG